MTAMLLSLGMALGTSATSEIPAQTQLQIDATIFKGDPLGSKAEGNVDVLSRPQVRVLSSQTAFVQVGQQVPVPAPGGKIDFQPTGVTLKLTPTLGDSGEIHLEVNSQITEMAPTPVDLGNGVKVPAFNCEAVLVTRMLKDTQTVRVRLGARSPTDQTWAELTVRVVRPMP